MSDPARGCARRAASGLLQRRLPSIPALLALHRRHPRRYPFLIESLAGSGPSSRYDVLFAFPGEEVVCHADGTLQGAQGDGEGDFLAALDGWWQREHEPLATTSLPFTGGWFVYLGYELAAQVEPRLRLPRFPEPVPVAFATRVPAAIIVDRHEPVAYLVAEEGCGSLLDAMDADLRDLGEPLSPALQPSAAGSGVAAEEDPALFLRAVGTAKEYIAAGDVFQVNLSRLWSGELSPGVEPADLYARLREANPAPFAGFVSRGDWHIASSSPERLVRVSGDVIDTRPIAGTRPRGDTSQDDLQQWQTLLGHPKERAEHIMLIDLERNDLGRVCVPGSVRVSELMVLESYRHVHHIVSNVQGRLQQGVTPGQVLRAVFPGGTITGCPKVRCMEIIAELEHVGRGPYTGALGYLNRDGSMDMNILIRTVSMHGHRWCLRAGAGIVADSVPQSELEETRAKARGLLTALGCWRP